MQKGYPEALELNCKTMTSKVYQNKFENCPVYAWAQDTQIIINNYSHSTSL